LLQVFYCWSGRKYVTHSRALFNVHNLQYIIWHVIQHAWCDDLQTTRIYIHITYIIIYNTFRSAALSTRVNNARVNPQWWRPRSGWPVRITRRRACEWAVLCDAMCPGPYHRRPQARRCKSPRRIERCAFITSRSLPIDFDEITSVAHTRNHTHTNA